MASEMENYNKNKSRVEWLMVNKENVEGSFQEVIIEESLFNEYFECHCRCCEDLYLESGIELIHRSGKCRCGSFRLEIYK